MFCLHLCLRTLSGQKRVLYPLELEIQTAVSHHIVAENQDQILWEEQPVLLLAEPSLEPHIPKFIHPIQSAFTEGQIRECGCCGNRKQPSLLSGFIAGSLKQIGRKKSW